jgi:3-oxoacyl-[acyl-carrier-protein] synthase-1
LREVLLEPIGESLAPGAYLAGLEVVELGHSAAIAAVQRAEEGMARREFDRAIVLAVDSLLDSMTLEWLTGENRVKCDANPTGLAPGEAAACLLLEQPERARGGRRPWMTLRGAALRREKASFVSGDTNQGDALCASIRAARSRAGVSSGLYADIITDQNGENWRASELAYARIKLREELGPGCRFLHPAASIGDTGAASGGVALCFAACAFRRGFARGDSALVLSSTERGDVGAALVGAAE